MSEMIRQPNCEVQVNNWIIPTAVGSVAGFLGGMIARSMLKHDSDATRHTVGYIVETSTFMLIGGVVWLVMSRRPKNAGGWLDY